MINAYLKIERKKKKKKKKKKKDEKGRKYIEPQPILTTVERK